MSDEYKTTAKRKHKKVNYVYNKFLQTLSYVKVYKAANAPACLFSF